MTSEGGDGVGEAGGAHGEEVVGSVAEEAAKLFGALSDLARGQGADAGPAWSGLASSAATHAAEGGDHPEGGECRYCPVCRAVHLARQTSPEVRDHLAAAAGSLLQAAAGLLATAVPPEARTRAGDRGRGHGVEHIDLDDQGEDDAERGEGS